LFTKYLLQVSVLTAPSSGRILITSQKHLLIVVTRNVEYIICDIFLQIDLHLFKQYYLVVMAELCN